MTTTTTETRRLYSPEQVGELLGVSRSTVYRIMGEGLLDSIKVGAARRITGDQVDRYIAALMAEQGASTDPVPDTANVTQRPNAGRTRSVELADAALRAIHDDTRQAG